MFSSIWGKSVVEIKKQQRATNSILLSDLSIKGKDGVVSSSHSVEKVTISSLNNKVGYFKRYNDAEYYPEELAKIEAGLSGYYRLVLGEKAADTRPVYDDNDNFIGVISIGIDNFKSFNDEYANIDALLQHNVAELLVASIVREEDDLHPGNMGLLGRIDFDMSWYTKTSKIKGKRLIAGFLIPLPEKAFDISDQDIRSLLINLTSAVPCFWPSNRPKNLNYRKDYQNRDEFLKLNDDSQFKLQIFKAFLKEILIDKNCLSNTFKAYCDDADIVKEITNHFYQRIKELRQTLLAMPEFKNYVKKNPLHFHEIIAWFNDYNINIAKEAGKVNIDDLVRNYHLVLRDCYEDDLTNNLQIIYHVIEELKKEESEHKVNQGKESELYSSFVMIGESPRDVDATMVTTTTTMVKQNPRNIKSKHDIIKIIQQCNTELTKSVKDYYNIEKPTQEQIDNFIFASNQILNSFRSVINTIKKSTIRQDADAAYKRLNSAVNKLRASIVNGNYQLEPSDEVKSKETDIDVSYLYMPNHQIKEKPISIISKALYSWLIDKDNDETISEIINVCLNEYKPRGNDTGWGYINPYAYTSARSNEIEKIITDGIKSPIDMLKEITSNGNWNQASKSSFCIFSTGQSFNSRLLEKLCKEMIKEFRALDTFTQQQRNPSLLFVCQQQVDFTAMLQGIRNQVVNLHNSKQHRNGYNKG